MKKQWFVRFQENGGEYEGCLLVTAEKIRRCRNDGRAFIADNVHIQIDEAIIEIRRARD